MWTHLPVQLLGATYLGHNFWQLSDEPRTILQLWDTETTMAISDATQKAIDKFSRASYALDLESYSPEQDVAADARHVAARAALVAAIEAEKEAARKTGIIVERVERIPFVIGGE